MRSCVVILLLVCASSAGAQVAPSTQKEVLRHHLLYGQQSEPVPLNEAQRLRFDRLAGFGILGAAVGTGALAGVAAAAGDYPFDTETDYRAGEADEAEVAVMLVVLLPYLGSMAGVQAAAGEPIRSGRGLFVMGGASVLTSLAFGAGAAVLTNGFAPAVVGGFVAGAGLGAAAGCLEARRLDDGGSWIAGRQSLPTMTPDGPSLTLQYTIHLGW